VKILLADHDTQRAQSLMDSLRAQDASFQLCQPVPGEGLVGAVQRLTPDIVLVDMARPDRDSLDSVRQLHESCPYPVMMFIDEDDPAFMEAAIEAGVVSYHVRGAALPEIKPIMRTAMALFRRNHELTARLAAAEDQLVARRRIDAAKRLLMQRGGLSEPAAHRFLQRRAMESQRRVADIAAKLLREAGEELP